MIKQIAFVCLGNENVVSLLLKKDAKASVLDKELRTPLHFAAKNGDFSYLIYLQIAILKLSRIFNDFNLQKYSYRI